MTASRREVLERLRLGATLLPVFAFAPRSLLQSLLFEPEGQTVAAKPLPANPYVRNGKSLVALVHGQDPDAVLAAAMELLGGIDRIGIAGQRVLIKPNVVNDRPPPSTTSPETLAAVIRLVRQAGAREVIVADSSGMLRFPTRENLAATGIRAAAEAAGATVLALEEEPWVAVEPEKATYSRRYFVSKPVYDADVFINLPVVKTHRFAHYSCSLKNLVGIVHPRNRPSIGFLGGHWHERIADLNLAVHPQLTIADGRTIMIAGGPTSGTPVAANVLLASGDRVALDAVALALIRFYGAWDKVKGRSPWEQRQLVHAIELGLGARGAAEMELVTRSLDGGTEWSRLEAAIRKDL
jgi:uncharacterized protein (DUF362 family)